MAFLNCMPRPKKIYLAENLSRLKKEISMTVQVSTDPFSEEHELFRGQCRKFVERELSPHAREWEEKKEFPNEVFRRVGEMGYHGMLIPEEYGGVGPDHLLAAVW